MELLELLRQFYTVVAGLIACIELDSFDDKLFSEFSNVLSEPAIEWKGMDVFSGS